MAQSTPGTLGWRTGILSVAGAALLALGCNQQPAPLTSASGTQASYAERYPKKLEAVRTRFAEDETEARNSLPELRRLPDSLKGTDYAHVKEVVERADELGKSSAYAEDSREADAVRRFLVEEKDPLRQKVAGGVNYAAKQKDCSEDLGGAAVASMERGIDKQLEERLRSRSDAHRYIEEHEEELGKANVDALEKQADAIAKTSHIVNVRLELHRRELASLLEEKSAAKNTLDDIIRRSDETLADAKISRRKKEVVERRKSAAQEARNRIDIDTEQSERALQEMELRIGGIRDEYDAALKALVEELDKRATAN